MSDPTLPADPLALFRFFLKDDIRDLVDFRRTDQSRGVPPPPIQKPPDPAARRVALVAPTAFDEMGLGRMPVLEAIRRRESAREFTEEPLSLVELSFLLWTTQGVRMARGRTALRTVPSAGNRHALESYVACRLVEGVERGLYRYLPRDHALVLEREGAGLEEGLWRGCRGQAFAAACAAAFIWTALPYRMEWRYGLAAHKVIALDAGHVCQNLYLACQAIGAGTCAIAAYDQAAMDRLVGADGEDEFVVYLAPVGKVA
jgi:SagB-type dehydrogenase family enzyme